MASGYRNSAGVDAEDLYDPDTVGDGPVATGYRKADGSTLRYAAAKYGTPGAAMGYRLSSGVDIGTLWARKGTAAYALPINGGTYAATLTRSGASGAVCALKFSASGTGWVLSSSGSGGTASPNGNLLTGSLPTGASTIAYTWSSVTGGAAVNGSATPIALDAGPSAYVQVTGAGTISTASGSAVLRIEIFNGAGQSISVTTCTLQVAIVNPP